MGGKNYFCDYCRCYMKNDIKVRKTHNEGLAHTIMKVTVMRQFEDPRKVYQEEIEKQPCSRYFKGYCRYDLFCRNSHFNEKQLKQLKDLAENINRRKISEASQNERTPVKKSKQMLKLPWENNISKGKLKQLPKKLPPSLRPLRLSKLLKMNVSQDKWG